MQDCGCVCAAGWTRQSFNYFSLGIVQCKFPQLSGGAPAHGEDGPHFLQHLFALYSFYI